MVNVTAKNLTNSPFDFLDSGNRVVRFPAFGTATGDFTGSQLELINFWMSAGGLVPTTGYPWVLDSGAWEEGKYWLIGRDWT